MKRIDVASERGFTLLEMVCVIALVAMVATVLLPFVPRNTSKARLQAYALEAASLLKADRNAAIRRGVDVSTLVDAPSRAIRSRATVRTPPIPAGQGRRPGRLEGPVRAYGCQDDIGQVGGGWVIDNADVAWIPELVKIRVRSPSGAAIDLETVRLMRGQKR